MLIQQSQFRPGRILKEQLCWLYAYKQMRADSMWLGFQIQSQFHYPFTLTSLPKRAFTSAALPQPTVFEVYCPLSCKKIKIGAVKDKNKEAMEFNTTASRWVSTFIDQQLRYLINGNPPLKKDRKKVEGSGWGCWVQVSQKGNYAVFNPYCTLAGKPLSLYIFAKLESVEKEHDLEERFVQAHPQNGVEEIRISDQTFYVKQSNEGSFIGVNPYFQDDINGVVTLVHPKDQKKVLRIELDEAVRIVTANRHFWLGELGKIIDFEQSSDPSTPIMNLDLVYQKLQFTLHLEEQLRAKLMNSSGSAKAAEYFPYHPRLYSAWSRLASFINYGNTKYNIISLAEAGFYNKSDMLQDLAFYQHPDIPIPVAEDPAFNNENELRHKLFPFSRVERGLPVSNVPLSAVSRSLLHQNISDKRIIFREIRGHYLLVVDEDYNVSLWSCSLFPVRLFTYNANSECERANTSVVQSQTQMLVSLPNVEKEEAGLASLFEEAPPAKQVKPVEVVPDQAMVEQMQAMGYGINIIKKALIAVKNESVPAAIDMIDQITSEQKKKKVEQRREWSCSTCTYINKPETDTCEMCGELCDLAEQAEKERLRLEQEAAAEKERKKEQERLRLEREKEEERLRKEAEQAERLRILKEKQEQLRKSRLIGVHLIVHSTPIDPFFLVLLFRNEIKQINIVKVVRFGLDRAFFSKFYKIQDKTLMGNLSRVPLPVSLSAFEEIASKSGAAMEWGIRLIENFSKDQWILSQLKEFQSEYSLTTITSRKGCCFALEGQGKSINFEITTNDELKQSSFQVARTQENLQPEIIREAPHHVVQAKQDGDFFIANAGQDIQLDEKVTEVSIQVLQHLSAGKWQPAEVGPKIAVQGHVQGEVTMSELLPLVIEHYQGSVFSGKHYSCSLLQKSSNLYISNYPQANFTFRHDSSRRMFAERVVIVSSSKRLQRIYAVHEGLIFTANQPSWFHLAKERFSGFTKADYEEWLGCKKARNNHREFWEPVGFFQLENEAQIDLDYKRSAKYIFLLPTTVKQQGERKKDEIYAIKIDFFGVKGRLEEQRGQEPWYENYRSEGKTDCEAAIFNCVDGKQEPVPANQITARRLSQVNSFHFLPKNPSVFTRAPISATSIFTFRIRDAQHRKVVRITSENSLKLVVRVKRDISQQVDYTSITSFAQLAKNQNEIALPQLKKLAQRLDLKELLLLLLAADEDCSRYETLMNKIDDAPLFKEHLFEKMLELVPILVDESIPIVETGFKFFLTLYEKALLTHSQHSFRANTEALKRITAYVSQNRNKNYNLLRSKYNIEELALEPYLFSKDYYRQIHPNYVEKQPAPLNTMEPTEPLNNTSYLDQLTPYAYRHIIDLHEVRRVENIRLYVPKITSTTFRPKLALSVYAVDDSGDKLLYSRYFHEDLLVQLGVNGFKDNEIYRGARLNCLTISNLGIDARMLRVQASFLLLTTQPHIKYKDPADKFHLIPLVDSTPSPNAPHIRVQKQLTLLQAFPQQPRHVYAQERLPPAKYLSEGSKSIFHIHDFPRVQAALAKKEYRQIVQRITTNILDESIVREALASLKISSYELNHKGIDFAYTYVLYLMNFNRKYQIELRVSVDLALQIFETFVVFEIGPIAKKAFAFLQDTFKRFTNLEKATFSDGLIDRYLTNIEQLPTLKISERYSPLKIIEKLQQFELPVGNLIAKLQKYSGKAITLILVKLITSVATSHGIANLEQYSVETGKYSGKLQLLGLSQSSFKTCLWVLDNVHGLREQALTDSLDVLLLFLAGQVAPVTAEARVQSAKQFIEQINEQQLWKLVFLTLKLKSQALKERINRLFTVLTANLTEQFRKSSNQMVLQIISRQPDSIYVQINHELTQQQWMNHLQTTLELISLTKDSVVLDEPAALKLLELPLTPTLWSRALSIIPRSDPILLAIIRNFPKEYYNSLGKEIAKFCEPLAGLKSLQSTHVNWLQLIRQLRLQGRSLFELFVLQLQKSSFGGKEGLSSATVQEVNQLQASCDLLKLLLDSKISREHFSEENVRLLVQWYFLNKCKEKGQSPATDKLLYLSQSIRNLFQRMTDDQEIVKRCIRCLLQVRKESEVIESNFEEKRVPIHSALTLNKRFSECFEELLSLFMTTDALSSYFAFELKGLSHILATMDIGHREIKEVVTSLGCTPEEELLLAQKIMATRANKEQPAQVKELQDLKEEQFANSVKLVPNLNPASLAATNADWSSHKKGSKTKLLFIPLTDPVHHNEFPLYLHLSRTAEVRSIKVGFLAASYEFNDKLVATPSAIMVEGSVDGSSYEPIGEMDYIQDDAYIMNGVQVWSLNCQKTKAIGSIQDAVQSLNLHKVRFLKLIVRRPTVTFIEGQYSQLNGKNYSALGCNLSFLSVVGDDCDKHSLALADSCREISKRSSLNLLATLLNESNPLTMRHIANDQALERLFRDNFKRIRDYMGRYPEVMPGVVYLIGAGNRKLGDWLVESFLVEGGGELQARIINQIITSTPDRSFPRLALFLKSVLRKLAAISAETEIESGVLYAKEIHFLEAFCKTLEECYELGLSGGVLQVKQSDIDHIIAIYDKKHSSPEIKSLLKLLIHLLHVRHPLSLDNSLALPVMDQVWRSCTDQRSHFYTLMAGLLIDRKAGNWLRESGLQKIDHLVQAVYSSITHGQWKNLKLQLFLLGQISYHESHYLRSKQVQAELYNRLKNVAHQDAEITDAVLRIIRNIVLGNVAQEEAMARLLLQDVGLLVKKRDPFLQKLFVGVLGLESQVMIHVSGLDLQSSVKKQAINSKFLSKKHQKTLLDHIGKKCKYSLVGQINGTLSAQNQDLFLKAFSCGSLLVLLRFQLHDIAHTIAIHAPAPSKRNQQGDYFWEEVINYEKNGFICFLQEDPLFISRENGDHMLANIYGGDEQQDNAAVIYDDSQEVIQFTFSTSEASVPKLTLTKYKNQLPNELTGSTLDQDHEGYSFVGVEFWQLRGLSSVNVSDSKLGSLLSKSNQARPPFSYYRHSPIYIFPANITISKFIGLLGLRGSCTSKGKQLSADRVLKDLERESCDFIIDLEISQEQGRAQDEEVSEFGYIPLMSIFNHFSRLQGVNDVLRLGSQSLRDWKKADRKKNFQHYMQELKSFISLPNFFNLFIKNQQYVTLLFEVAAGLPDDENSTRNWQEQYVNNFRFIYKIVSDIFKYDRSPHLRNMDKYSDFLEVILDKLSEITKEAARVLKEEEKEEEVASPGNLALQKVKSEDRKRKKKGTGYGADNQNSSKWSASEWLEARKNVSQETLRVISIIASFLDCEQPLVDERFAETIKQSCLLPLLESQLRSGSLLDISKEPELFKSYLLIVRLLASHPATIECLLDLEKVYKPEQSESVLNLLHKLNGIAEIFTECLKSGKEQASSNQVAQGISLDIQRTHVIVDKAVKSLQRKKKVITIKELNSLPVAEAYRFLLNGLRFGYVNLKENGVFKHAHSSSISTSAPATSKVLRLSQELADLSSSLPCEHTNSIFVRCDRSRVDVINVLIMGSKDTPYSNGAFTFDVYCDDSYPNNPPKMLITTTGQGKIRFNPNLYSCGKVCLSLLGTWRGSASENWDPKVSTLLQLFISTQGITMSDDVYFNEPGFEGEQGTEEGERKNEAYSNIVRLGNVRYAMVGQIKSPPKGFEEVIKRHFYIKRHEIIEECEKWLEYAEKREASYNGLVNDHNSSWCTQLKQSKTKYRQLLLKEVNELKELLSSLPPPDLKQEQEEQPSFQKDQPKEKTVNKTQQLKLEEVDVGYDKGQSQVKEYEENVMNDRWSRYIGAMGLQAVKKQAESSVLLIGLKPLGLQIAKNLVLSGLKKLTIVESGDFKDHSEHFYMSNVKSDSIKDCIFKIKELNPYMLVEHAESLPNLSTYSVVISTEDYEKSLELALLSRAANIKFIYAESRGVSGIYFADLGDHQVNDDNGEEPFQGMIKHITNEEEGLVTLLDGVKHPYQDGDYVVLSKVVGMEEENSLIEEPSQAQQIYQKQTNLKPNGINNRVFKIKVVNWNSFRIGDTRHFKEYKLNGLCKNLKLPKKVQFKSLLDSSKDFNAHLDPNLSIYDFEKMGDNNKIFYCYQSLAQFKKSQATLPKNWTIKDANKFNEILVEIAKFNKSEEDEEKLKEFGRLFALTSEAELPSLGAYLGGVVAQEAIKAITNKYMPIRQFFTFHFNEMLQKYPENEEETEKNHVPQGEDFRSLKIVVGHDGADKIAQLKTFVIGAGAIGCELLKNFAMINMGAKGEILVTDPDHIETSNLSRQFLFREKHVKKAKSATACATLLQLNPRLEGHIVARLDKVCEETEEIFTNEFFTSRGIVANALDNLKARVYMDKRCVENKVPLFESGTLGPKGHVQVIVPYKTENYGSQNDPNEQAQIPHCTLKMFPEETVHCIEWARDIFGKIFTLNPKALKKVLEAKDLNILEGQQRETVARMINYRPESFDDCIAEAVRKFFVYYRNNVRQLLFTYPLDLKTKQGKLFWTLPKRPPTQISAIDEENENHRVFISSYAVLLAKIYNIPYPKDFRKPEGRKRIIEQAVKVKVEEFVPNAEASKELEKQVEKQTQKGQEKPVEEEVQPPKLEAKLSETVEITPELLEIKVSPDQFEKDEDSNGHIDLIYSMSNLRSQNYGLDSCTWIQAKLKAGKIMAALSTTTSVVAALQTIQIIKLATGSTIWRNAFINLAVPLVQITEPGPAPKHKLGNSEFTVWEDWQFKAVSLKDLLDQLRTKHEVQGFNISTSLGKPVYWQAMYKDKEEAREHLLNTSLKDLFGEERIQLHIAMRDPSTGSIYEHVPKVKVEVA